MSVADDDVMVRLDKLLAERGVGSRKQVDRLIRKGLVEVHGEVVGKSGAKLKVPWGCSPVVDGFDYPPPPLLAAYNKPLGVVSSMRDHCGRPDLSSVLPDDWRRLLHPVGRLDADTTGLLLFSRDGDLTHKLLHPKYGVEREYIAQVEGNLDEEVLRATLAAGVDTTEDGKTLVVVAVLVGVEGQQVRLTVTEGKHRMVRRLLANCGHPVVALHRVRYGQVHLDDLAEGDSVAVEAAWVSQLAAARVAELGAPPCKPPDSQPSNPPPTPPVPAAAAAISSPARQTGRRVNHGDLEERDLEEEMEAARWREWSPRPDVVEAVMLSADVEWDEALGALREQQGNVVEAIGALKG